MKPVVCVAVLFASYCLHEAASCVFGAPVRWEGNGNSYEVVPGNYDWLQAESLARQMGGHLATITTQAENDFVYGLTQGHWTPLFGTNTWWNYGPWIGAHRPFGPGTSGWNWVTPRNEEPFGSNPQFWAAGEPNNENGIETNAHYFTSRAASGASSPITAPTWNDLNFRADRTGASGLPFVVEYESCENLLRNSVRIEAVDGVIRAQFVPNLGYTLQQAASACNVQSFNWVQTVRRPERNRVWQISRPNFSHDPWALDMPIHDPGVPVILGAEVVELHGPIIDPILNGKNSVYGTTFKTPHGWFISYTMRFSVGSDEFPYYFNEYNTGLGDTPIVDEFISSNGRTLFFEDAPRAPLGFFDSNEFDAFTTRLAGVGYDGTPVFWSELGTTFTWKSNVVYDAEYPGFQWGGVYDHELVWADFLSTLESQAPPIFSGAIYDIQLGEPVPEPSSLLIAVIGSFVAVAYIRCRSTRIAGNASAILPQAGLGR